MSSDFPDFVSPATALPLVEQNGFLVSGAGESFPVIGGIPRFVEDSSYAESFGAQWKRYREVQLENGRSAERLRYGTVDAFQGMEFDVVFLSMVRSNTFRDHSENACRMKYWHLMSPNRLIEAMLNSPMPKNTKAATYQTTSVCRLFQ